MREQKVNEEFTIGCFNNGKILSINTSNAVPESSVKNRLKNLFRFPALIAGLGLILADKVTAQTFTTLHSFNGSDGADPLAGLILSGNTLYGTAAGILLGCCTGTVFAVNTDGTAFTKLH